MLGAAAIVSRAWCRGRWDREGDRFPQRRRTGFVINFDSAAEAESRQHLRGRVRNFAVTNLEPGLDAYPVIARAVLIQPVATIRTRDPAEF